MNDKDYLQQAVENSRKSFEAGNFPAGGILVKDGQVLSSTVSVPYPGLFHADAKAIMEAHNKIGPLGGATLYIGLESCLMCMGMAYWSGLRRIVYAVSKSKVSGDYYETHNDTSEVVHSFNEPIELIHIQDFEVEALKVIKDWEDKFLNK